jgi:hypothetical protein
MAIGHDTQHFSEALQALATPFWGKPRIAALLRAYIRRVQELENDAWGVLGAFDVNTADAARLAILGRIVGQHNAGWNTETYRAVIRAKIATNRSHGREDDLVNVLQLAAGLAEPVTIVTYAPATMIITLGETVTDSIMTALAFLLPKTRSAGVQLHMFRPTAVNTLEWADTSAPGSGSAFADTTDPGSGSSAYDTRLF